MNAEKHERSLLKAVSDAGSTPAASTKLFIFNRLYDYCAEICAECMGLIAIRPFTRRADLLRNAWLFLYQIRCEKLVHKIGQTNSP